MVGLGDPAEIEQAQPSAAPSFSARERASSARKKRSKIRGLQVGGDASSSIRDAQRVFQFYATAGHVDASTLRSLLDRVINRLRIIRRRRDSSAWMGDSETSSRFRDIPFASASGRPNAYIRLQVHRDRNRRGWSKYCPASARVSVKDPRDVREARGLLVKNAKRFPVILAERIWLR